MKIALYRGAGLVSWCIEKFTRGVYSHVSLLSFDETGPMLHSRSSTGVIELPSISTGFRPGTQVDIYEFSPILSEEQEAKAIAWAKTQLGKGYDGWGITRFLTRTAPRIGERENWFCSEYVTEACYQGGIHIFNPDLCKSWMVDPTKISWSSKLKLSKTITL